MPFPGNLRSNQRCRWKQKSLAGTVCTTLRFVGSYRGSAVDLWQPAAATYFSLPTAFRRALRAFPRVFWPWYSSCFLSCRGVLRCQLSTSQHPSRQDRKKRQSRGGMTGLTMVLDFVIFPSAASCREDTLFVVICEGFAQPHRQTQRCSGETVDSQLSRSTNREVHELRSKPS